MPALFSFGIKLFIGCEQHDLALKWSCFEWGIGADDLQTSFPT